MSSRVVAEVTLSRPTSLALQPPANEMTCPTRHVACWPAPIPVSICQNLCLMEGALDRIGCRSTGEASFCSCFQGPCEAPTSAQTVKKPKCQEKPSLGWIASLRFEEMQKHKLYKQQLGFRPWDDANAPLPSGEYFAQPPWHPRTSH